MIKKLLLSTLLLTGFINARGSIGLDINSEDVELLGAYSLNDNIGYTGGTNFIIDGGYLHNSKDDLFTLGLQGENALKAAPGLIFGFGFKVAFAENFMAAPLFCKVKFILPFDSDIPTSTLMASYTYAPSVLTFSDGDSYSELRLEGDVEVISNIHIFAGYRNINTDYKTYDYKLNDSFYGGLKLNF